MAFRPPREQEQGVPSLGYRLSSNRQPGIEQSNNMMPNYQKIGDLPGARFNPGDMMPMPEYKRPLGRPGMGNYQQMGRQSSDPRERYIADTQGGHPNMSQFGYFMQDRGPTTTDPIMTMLDDPQVMLDFNDARKLEEQMDPGNFFGNRMDIGEQFNVDPFGDIDYPRMSIEFGEEEAAVDPSDYRTIMKMIEAGMDPNDYMAANRGGIASLRR
tara:strand:+ start:1832 stop:2470 length:639 start_codon:yes stop_codon:yes gene_type:complete